MRHEDAGVNGIMYAGVDIRRIPPQFRVNWCRNTAIQLDFFAEIRDNVVNTGANGAVTPPPPDQDGGSSSTMISPNYSAKTEPPQPRKTYPQDWPAYNAAQTSEKDTFMVLLADLCTGISQVPPRIWSRIRLVASTHFLSCSESANRASSFP